MKFREYCLANVLHKSSLLIQKLDLPPTTAHVKYIVWHLPINMSTGPLPESNWFKVANQYPDGAAGGHILVLHVWITMWISLFVYIKEY